MLDTIKYDDKICAIKHIGEDCITIVNSDDIPDDTLKSLEFYISYFMINVAEINKMIKPLMQRRSLLRTSKYKTTDGKKVQTFSGKLNRSGVINIQEYDGITIDKVFRCSYTIHIDIKTHKIKIRFNHHNFQSSLEHMTLSTPRKKLKRKINSIFRKYTTKKWYDISKVGIVELSNDLEQSYKQSILEMGKYIREEFNKIPDEDVPYILHHIV